MTISAKVGRGGFRRAFAPASLMGLAAALALGHASAASPAEAGGEAVARFQAAATPPPVLAGRLPATGSLHAAQVPQGTVYAVMDGGGKAKLWLVRGGGIAAELAAPASQAHLDVDWPGSYAFSLGNLPVVALSWRFRGGHYGVESLAFWAIEGAGRSLGGLPGSTRNPCGVSGQSAAKDCPRCAVASGIPLDARLSALGHGQARFTQQRAATWCYYFGAAAETFEQDYLLTATGLAPEGPARAVRRTIPLPQAKERAKRLLRDYFALAKGESRQRIAPEFLACFEQLVSLAPDFAQGHYNVGCMNALLGNRQQAVASVTKAIALDPKYRKVARKDPDLETVRDDPELASLLAE